MLKALADCDDNQRVDLLVKAAAVFLPKPEQQGESSPILSELIRELSARAKVDPADPSPASRAAILQELVGELSQLLLAQGRVPEVKARLGDRGELPPKQYRVDFDPSFENAAQRGIRRSYIVDALQSPDAVQHLPDAASSLEPRASLYTKRVEGSRHLPDPFVFLIHTRRSGDLQHVVTAWNVYPADVPLTEASCPLDVLEAFLSVYGLEAKVANNPSGRRLIVGERVPLTPGQAESQILQWNAQGIAFESSQTIRTTPNVAVEIALAYAVNMSKYLADLKAHGVSVDVAYWTKSSMHIGVDRQPTKGQA